MSSKSGLGGEKSDGDVSKGGHPVNKAPHQGGEKTIVNPRGLPPKKKKKEGGTPRGKRFINTHTAR